MINNYPRIWGLSTLGIIYHFNTDYKFHPLRTDFSGEGGSGKTMVADMIQLILVGPGVYKSATDGTDKRPIDGLVSQPKNKEYGAGYIILNIETAPKEFIAIGSFIEKSSKQAKMFIVQSGFDWENTLTTLSKPVFYKDLLVDGKIISVEQLQDQLQNIHIKALPLKQYHRLLFENNILPLDLSESKNTLESYARIFRSFSRGSGFKTDSKNLKNFLFSDDDKILLAKYHNEVKSISDDFQEHDRYKKEIDLINRKQGFVKEVMLLYTASSKLNQTYVTEKVLYWKGQQTGLQKAFKDAQKEYDKAKIERQLINVRELEYGKREADAQILKYRNSESALIAIRDKKQTLSVEKEKAYEALQKAQFKKSNVTKVTNWLLKHNADIEKLKTHYTNEVAYNNKKTLLNSFVEHIKTHKIQHNFENSDWSKDFKNTEDSYEIEFKKSKRKLEEINALSIFADLQNPSSLASWAINHFKRPLTKEEESVLVYFQSLPPKANDNPIAKDRYIQMPEELFLNLDIKNVNDNGFWINLDGVYEFIEYVPKQYLDINEEEKQKTITELAKLKRGLSDEIKELTRSIASAENLKKRLFEFSNVANAVSLYAKRNEYSRLPDEEWLIAEDQFHELMTDYASKGVIEKEYAAARDFHEDLIKQEGNTDPHNFQQQNEDAIEYFKAEEIDLTKLDEYIGTLSDHILSEKGVLTKLQQELNIDALDIARIENALFGNKSTRSAVLQLKATHVTSYVASEGQYQDAKNAFDNSKAQLENAKKAYQMVFKSAFPEKDERMSVSNDPDAGEDSLMSKYNRSRIRFEEKYNLITEEIEEGEQLKDTFHIGQLAHRLLPTVFTTPDLNDEIQLDSQLTDRLKTLSQVLKEIGSRKIEILKRVFAEVNKTYRDHLDKVNKIDTYFKNPNKGITGGNRGSLKYGLSNDYPAKWMTVFSRVLDEQLTHTQLFEQLATEVDINDMMKKAFLGEGGTKDADIEDLLNPKSYFDLDFKLRLENGDGNAGSNSQTYSANALLGLARLSIIEGTRRKGIRIMPIDEAQGLGSNYEMLKAIAIEEEYQILSMSIDTAGEIKEGEQYIYTLSENSLSDEDNYVPAMGIFSENQVTDQIENYVRAGYD